MRPVSLWSMVKFEFTRGSTRSPRVGSFEHGVHWEHIPQQRGISQVERTLKDASKWVGWNRQVQSVSVSSTQGGGARSA